MRTYKHRSFIFTALDDFRAHTKLEDRLAAAEEFGIQIVYDNELKRSDYTVKSGPFWRFRRRIEDLIRGVDNDGSFFIRMLEVSEGSNLKLYYYDPKANNEAVVEIKRRPGLHLCFRSGKDRDLMVFVDMICGEDNQLHFFSFGDTIVVE